MKYSIVRWKSSPGDNTSWTNSDNWEEGVTTSLGTGDVIIPALESSSEAPNISGTTTVPSDNYLILEPGAKASFGTLSNSGTVHLQADADSLSSLIVSTYTGNDALVDIYLTGGYEGIGPDYKWHYVSSPFTTSSSDDMYDTLTSKTLDFAQYIESRVTDDELTRGWVAYDGYDYYTGLYSDPLVTFSNLTSGKGYNYYDADNDLLAFEGVLNTSNVVVDLEYGDNGVDL